MAWLHRWWKRHHRIRPVHTSGPHLCDGQTVLVPGYKSFGDLLKRERR